MPSPINKLGATYWLNQMSRLEQFIQAGKFDKASVSAFIESMPNYAIPQELCVTSAIVNLDKWIDDIRIQYPLWNRAMLFLNSGKEYLTRDSMELRCVKCSEYSKCPKVDDETKNQFCFNVLYQLGLIARQNLKVR
jgi:hypothetical protein